MTILEKITYFQQVWLTLMPYLQAPAPEDAARWLSYPLEDVEGAILRTAKRFAQHKIPVGFDVKQAYRYTTGTARSIAQRAAVTATTQESGAARSKQ
jgi:hypothetical protein